MESVVTRLEAPPDKASRSGSGLVAVSVVLFVVFLNLLNALILKHAAAAGHSSLVLVGAFIAVVLLINLGRVVLWGWIHRRYSLARSYPLTAIFFPLIAMLSWWEGEPVTAQAVVGVVIITLGVLWYALFVPEDRP